MLFRSVRVGLIKLALRNMVRWLLQKHKKTTDSSNPEKQYTDLIVYTNIGCGLDCAQPSHYILANFMKP
ncbi:MAG: hypothetical protein JWQ25_451 [Daejeonella sp.]|nr:hypothetical protein [Daejeonella sp.]